MTEAKRKTGGRWKPAELASVLRHAEHVHTRDGKFGSSLLMIAQCTLPPDRRLGEATVKNPRVWSKPLLTAFTSAGWMAPSTPSVEEAAPEPTAERLESFSFDQLFGAVVRKLRKEAEAQVSETIRQALSELQPPSNPEPAAEGSPATTPRASVPRYLVVGLLPAQEVITQARLLSSPVELRFAPTGAHNLKALARWCDCAFIMTRFISHDTGTRIRNAGAEVQFVNGSVTDLVSSITLKLKTHPDV